MSFQLTIPIFSEKLERPGEKALYRVRPLFFGGEREEHVFSATNEREDRALQSLQRDLRLAAQGEAIEMRHDLIARWSFCPEITVRRLTLELSLRKQTIRGDFVVALYKAFEDDRRLAMCPTIPGLTFEIGRGEHLEHRAEEVFAAHFKWMEKRWEEPIDPAEYLSSRFARMTTIDLEIRVNQRFKSDRFAGFAFLGGSEKLSGPAELEKTGRCLNRLYPNDLHRAILRDGEVSNLERHFSDRQRIAEPLVLIGPSQAGKTAVIHEFLHRRMSDDRAGKREVWLLSPQRLISGMSYVGQWEERVHAILKEAASRKHILLFEDLPGLFQAGKSRDSDLTVGHLLKAYLEEGSLQVLAEITPGAWRKLREVDRGFADFFKTVHIREPGEGDTLRILIRTMQQLEARHRCCFQPEVLPLVLQLQRRFVRTRAFPGKAVEMLRQLAGKRGADDDEPIDEEAAFRFFENKTGIRRQFLSREAKVNTEEVRDFFERRIMGQGGAIDVMVDAVVSCSAQLNDPSRPMASLLFLGPTGVGKTECAKVLAEYFFGSAERLLRFDMNEFVGGDAVSRLIGSQVRPRGLLTGAIRSQPYAVLLLDEIEKADSSVFDLLLQLLGDGRLTDARGETADFGNCIVIMTSNLGARAARHQLGFGAGSRDETRVYREAAEKFFRPELFNRIDRIVAFHELTRGQIRSLAGALTAKALDRPGVTGRRLGLTIDPGVDEALAGLGFKPEYGARALRRAIEEHLVEPLALSLGDLPQNEPATVRLSLADDKSLQFSVSHFVAAPAAARNLGPLTIAHAESLSDAVNRLLRRIDDELENWFGESADGTFDPRDPGRVGYFNLREEMAYLRRLRDRFGGLVEAERKTPPGQRRSPSRFGRDSTWLEVPREKARAVVSEFYAAANTGTYLKLLAEEAAIGERVAGLGRELVFKANRLDFLAKMENREPERVFLRLSESSNFQNSIGKPEEFILDQGIYGLLHSYFMSYLKWFGLPPNLEGYVQQRDQKGAQMKRYEPGDTWIEEHNPYFDTAFFYGEGPGLSRWLEFEKGVQLFATNDGAIEHGHLEVFPLEPDETTGGAYARIAATPPWIPGSGGNLEVTRIHHQNGITVDLRTGRISNERDLPLWNWLLPLAGPAPEFAPFYESLT